MPRKRYNVEAIIHKDTPVRTMARRWWLSNCASGQHGWGLVFIITLIIPITHGLNPSSGLIVIAGVYYGAIFGGPTSAILINAPSVAGVVASALDDYVVIYHIPKTGVAS